LPRPLSCHLLKFVPLLSGPPSQFTPYFPIHSKRFPTHISVHSYASYHDVNSYKLLNMCPI
jgi:hypothetical protein